MSLRLMKAKEYDRHATVWLVDIGLYVVLSLVLVVLWLSLPNHRLLPQWAEVVGVVLALTVPFTVTRVRLTSVEPKIVHVATLWLGLIAVRTRRQAAQVIVADHSMASEAEDPDQLTFNLGLDDPWSLDCVGAEEVAALLSRWQATK